MEPSRSRRGIDTTTAVVEGAADGLADGIDREGLGHSLPHLAGQTAPIAQRGSRSERLRAKLEKADEKVSAAIDSTRVKARAVAESARRARKAPGHLLDDAKAAASAYAGGIAASVGFYAAAGAVALVAAILITVGLVQGLNRVWGRPWGTFAVAVLYGIGAIALAGAARGKREAGRREALARIEAAKSEARRVVEPVRNAFRRQDTPLAAQATMARQSPMATDIGADAHATVLAAQSPADFDSTPSTKSTHDPSTRM